MTTNQLATVDLQLATDYPIIPTLANCQAWVDTVLAHLEHPETELTIRLVDEDESQELNRTYRHKDKPTNVLSFPMELPDYIEEPLLGDLVICAPIVAQEAEEQGKPCLDHWAHMIIHGTLHLLGYDHIEDDDAEVMESLEIHLLSQLGIANPY